VHSWALVLHWVAEGENLRLNLRSHSKEPQDLRYVGPCHSEFVGEIRSGRRFPRIYTLLPRLG